MGARAEEGLSFGCCLLAAKGRGVWTAVGWVVGVGCLAEEEEARASPPSARPNWRGVAVRVLFFPCSAGKVCVAAMGRRHAEGEACQRVPASPSPAGGVDPLA